LGECNNCMTMDLSFIMFIYDKLSPSDGGFK